MTLSSDPRSFVIFYICLSENRGKIAVVANVALVANVYLYCLLRPT